MLIYPSEKKFPELSFNTPEKSIEDFTKYYNKNLGGKPEMLDSYIKFKSHILLDNPLPNKAVIGKNGWYFLGDDYNGLFSDSFGNYPFSNSELITIKNNIAALIEKLNSKGVAFHIVVPPNKHRVYPENLPFRLRSENTRLKQLNTFLKKEIDFEILDLKDTLYASKNKELLYYKTNTHWNDLGAYIGYYKTLQSLELNVPYDPISNYTYEYRPIKRGDITAMINLELNEEALFLDSKYKSEVEVIQGKRHHLHYKNGERHKKLIMYRDSFSNAWIKFFNQSFGETIYFRGYKIRDNYIEQQKPDVVIFEIIERNLGQILLDL